MFWQLILVATAVAVLYHRWTRRRLYRLAAEIPSGMKSYPIIGHAYKFLGNSEDRMKTFHELGRISNEQGGFSSIWLANELFIGVTDPIAIEIITKACLDKPYLLKFIRTVIGNGSIFAPVDIWHPRRKHNAPFFSMKNLNYLVTVFDQKSKIMVDLMRVEAGRGDFPIWKYFTTFTFDTVCETAVGIPINSQGKSEHMMLHAIDVLSQMVSERMLQPWLYPDFIYQNLPVYKKFMHEKKQMCDFVDKIVQNKRAELAAVLQGKDIKTAQSNYLDMIIQSSGANGKGYSDMELREEILVMVVAGNDTSAVAASFTAVLLSRYPDVQEKVYQELQEVFGDSDRPVTPGDLPRLKYLEAVIKESLRLYPPVPAAARLVHDDVVLPSGKTLVSGTNIFINIWGTHRNPAYWGEDAELFRPERFLRGALPHPAMFIPFNYSIRSCIGSTYAMFSAKTGLANLVRRFRLLPPAGARAADLTRPLPVKFDIMMKAVDNFIVRVEERNKTILIYLCFTSTLLTWRDFVVSGLMSHRFPRDTVGIHFIIIISPL